MVASVDHDNAGKPPAKVKILRIGRNQHDGKLITAALQQLAPSYLIGGGAFLRKEILDYVRRRHILAMTSEQNHAILHVARLPRLQQSIGGSQRGEVAGTQSRRGLGFCGRNLQQEKNDENKWQGTVGQGGPPLRQARGRHSRQPAGRPRYRMRRYLTCRVVNGHGSIMRDERAIDEIQRRDALKVRRVPSHTPARAAPSASRRHRQAAWQLHPASPIAPARLRCAFLARCR